MADLIRVMDANPKLQRKDLLIGPSTSHVGWTPEMVWDTGYIEAYRDRLAFLTVER